MSLMAFSLIFILLLLTQRKFQHEK
jgi:hypothetical protein